MQLSRAQLGSLTGPHTTSRIDKGGGQLTLLMKGGDQFFCYNFALLFCWGIELFRFNRSCFKHRCTTLFENPAQAKVLGTTPFSRIKFDCRRVEDKIPHSGTRGGFHLEDNCPPLRDEPGSRAMFDNPAD